MYFVKRGDFLHHKLTAYRILMGIARPLMKLLYRPRIIGAEYIPAEGGAVIAGNHKHAFDPVLVNTATNRTVRTLAKKELHDGSFGFFFRAIASIPVDLHAKHNPAALEAAVAALKGGSLINVSPEAGRNYTDELLLPFKYGAVSMSAKTGVPIIPYAISGDYRLFAKHRLTIRFSAPLCAKGEDLTDANAALYDRIAELLRCITDEEILRTKHFTEFKDWSTKHAPSS